MNLFICTGVVTRDAEIHEGGDQGDVCRFHLAVGAGKGRPDVWVQCAIWGKKASEVIDSLWQGQHVTVQGSLEPRERDQGGPIQVRAKNVIVHEVDEMAEPA